MDENQIREELKKYNFYHIIKLTENLYTSGWADAVPIQNVALTALNSLELENKRVLDIGCRDGLFCFEAEKLGAEEVIGIDNNLSIGAVNLLIPYFKSKVKMYELNVLDLRPEKFGMFDVVIFPGVLYHLRYPFWVLKLIKDVLHEGGQLIIETAVFMDDDRRSMLFCPIGSDSPYEATSCTFFNLKGLTDTLQSLGFVTQRIEFLHSKKGEDIDTGRKNLLSKIMHRVGFVKRVEPYIDRVTLICCKQAKLEDSIVSEYWNRTHKLEESNSVGS